MIDSDTSGAEKQLLLKFEGTPTKRGRREEDKRWKQFRKWLPNVDLIKRAYAFWRFGDEYVRAYVDEKKADAEIKQNQAANLAADLDRKKQEQLSAKFDLIDAVGLESELASEMKMASLLSENPELLERVVAFRQLRERMEREKGLRLHIPLIDNDDDVSDDASPERESSSDSDISDG